MDSEIFHFHTVPVIRSPILYIVPLVADLVVHSLKTASTPRPGSDPDDQHIQYPNIIDRVYVEVLIHRRGAILVPFYTSRYP